MLLSINNLKSIRKWRDRLFMLTENLRGRWALPRGRRILFSPWPNAEASIRRGFQHTRHVITFGEIPSGGGDYDLVVPFSIEALAAAGADEVLRRRNPLPLPSAAALELCHDKPVLNELLRANGFARHVPGPASRGVFPYMLKKGRDWSGSNSFCLLSATDESSHRTELDSPDYYLQEWIGGDTEYSAHILVKDGRVRRILTVEFIMQTDRAVHGRDPVLLMRRCHSRHTALFERMLQVVGFEGLCCVDYKVRGRIPYVLEINPRFGFSLGPFFSTFLRSLDWERAHQHRPGESW